MRACVRACVRARVRAGVRARVRACARACVHACDHHRHVTERSCSPCQSSVDYGNTKITQHALKVSESS